MKQGSEDHGKFRMLARFLKIPLPFANGIMERLWNKAAQFRPDGGVGRWTNAEIAEYCAMPIETDPDAFVQALVDAKLLDRMEGEARLYIHNWHKHCTHFTHNKVARQKQYFANGEAPSLKRLDHRYKQEAGEFYSVSAQNDDLSAQSASVSAQSASVSAQSASIGVHEKSFMSAQNGDLSAQRGDPTRARAPHPHPHPHPHPLRKPSKVSVLEDLLNTETAAAKNGAHVKAEEKWPLAAEYMTSRFPRTEPAMVGELAEIATTAITKAGGDPGKLTDAALRAALKEATFDKQRSAAGFRKTLPIVVTNASRKK